MPYGQRDAVAAPDASLRATDLPRLQQAEDLAMRGTLDRLVKTAGILFKCSESFVAYIWACTHQLATQPCLHERHAYLIHAEAMVLHRNGNLHVHGCIEVSSSKV
jgi:hypothetical protein